jgi:sortase A
VLNPIGIGHYPGTAMPGGVGNAAFAAHRTTWGAPFGPIADLRLGDSIYIETPEGWYLYKFRSLEYVLPTGVGVIEPVPQLPGVAPTERYITLTSCNPLYSAAERIVAYGVYETWYPRDQGAPEEIAAMYAQADGPGGSVVLAGGMAKGVG